MKKNLSVLGCLFIFLFLTGCSSDKTILHAITEHDANEIIGVLAVSVLKE